jgi:DNA modification methylase
MENINRILCGDNLESLQSLPSDSVDLCYIDPPFFTNRNYEVIWNDGAEVRQFGDRWVTENKDGSGRASKDINKYLEWMEPRIREIHRILKNTGSFYLHCDWHADAYLRVLCDEIFDRDPQSVIQWKRTLVVKGTCKSFGVNTDSILYYVKSNNFKWNPIKIQPSLELLERDYKMIEPETGRRFQAVAFVLTGDNPKTLTFPDGKIITAPMGKRYRWNQETLNERLKVNPLCIYWTSNNQPRLKKYVDTHEGNLIDNLWNDIIPLQSGSNERLGYPTQKPEALLERIIKASSNENDVILDCFCGCGTTLAVAKKLNRQFIGMDVSPTACRLVAKRISFKLDFIEGLPITPEEIAELDGNEFQNFVIREFGGFSGKRGADGGIDGLLGTCPIQVKKYKAGRGDLDQFSGALLRNNKQEAIYIALGYSMDFVKEVNRLKRDNKIEIHYFDVADIIAKTHYPIVDKFIPKQGLDKYKSFVGAE